MEHTPDPKAVVHEIRRCLKPGGFVHVVTPFCHPFHEYPRDYYRFSPDGLQKLVEPLEVVSVGWRTGPTATWLVVTLEYLKLWSSNRAVKRLIHVIAGWLLFPLRYLDWYLLRKADARQIGNHCYVWAQEGGLAAHFSPNALASSPQTLLPVTNHHNIPGVLFLQALRPHSPRSASQ